MPPRSRIIRDLQRFDVYASGPPAMVEAVRHEFIERGLPAEQLFFDSFDYAPDALAKLDAPIERDTSADDFRDLAFPCA